jgi:hypothetical protein
MPDAERVVQLKTKIETYQRAIHGFRESRERMIERHATASQPTKAVLEEQLDLNRKALEALNLYLEAAKKELQQ